MNDILLHHVLTCSGYKARVIRTLTRRQRNRCYLCHRVMKCPKGTDWKHPLFPTIDHVIPQSKGGTDDIDNLKISCRTCNLAKGDTLPRGVAWAARPGDGLRGGLGVSPHRGA